MSGVALNSTFQRNNPMKQQVNLGQRALKLVLGATVVGATLVAQSAYAAVVVVNFSANPFSTVPFNIDGVYINVVTGATGTSAVTTPGYDINPYFSGVGSTGGAVFRFLIPATGGMVGAAGTAIPLTVGTGVGPASSFISGPISANSTTSSTRFFGFSFLNEANSATHYGYVTVQQTANPPTAGSVRVLQYAYENVAGTAITVVPEPSTWLMMLGGLAIVGAGLRKRSQQAA